MTTVPTGAPAALLPVARPGRRARRSVWLGVCIVAALAITLAVDHRAVATTVVAALARASHASPWWLLAALALETVSIVAFGLLRTVTIRAAGGSFGTREAIAVSYAAGAVHLSAPGGVVLSTAYAFRRMRQRGVRPAAAAWSLTASGVLSTLTLVLLGAAGVAMVRGAVSWTALLPAAAMAIAIAVGVGAAARRPDLLEAAAVRVLGAANRVVRRPADTGAHAVRATVADLRAIHPAPGHWLSAGSVAAVNWLLDLLCLWACASALGIAVPPWALLTGYALAMAGAGLSPVPAGAGVVDGIMVLALTAAGGAPAGAAVGAVLLYRVISLGNLLVGGWGVIGLGTLRSRWAARATE